MYTLLVSLFVILIIGILLVVDNKCNNIITNKIVEFLIITIPSILSFTVILISFLFNQNRETVNIIAFLTCSLSYSLVYNYAKTKNKYCSIAIKLKKYGKAILLGLLLFAAYYSKRLSNNDFAIDICLYVLGWLIGISVVDFENLFKVEFWETVKQIGIAIIAAFLFGLLSLIEPIILESKEKTILFLFPWGVAGLISFVYIMLKIHNQHSKKNSK